MENTRKAIKLWKKNIIHKHGKGEAKHILQDYEKVKAILKTTHLGRVVEYLYLKNTEQKDDSSETSSSEEPLSCHFSHDQLNKQPE